MISKSDILKKLNSDGICVIPDYWPNEKCNAAIQEISSLPTHLFEKGQGGDFRCQHSNKHLKTALEFVNDKFIQSIANEYGDCCVANRTVLGVVKNFPEEKIDSGGGWHVDVVGKSQFKSFVYLTDVSPTTGPFTFIKNSKDKASQIETFSNLRIKDEDISSFCESDILEVCGKAGTLILADTSNIHRGKIIKEGTRVTYTTYFYNR